MPEPLAPPPPLITRRNNFGLLRWALASVVLVSHCVPLTQGNNAGEWLHQLTGNVTVGAAAVNGFFLVSGYLVTLSWLRSPTAGVFLRKRLARIYPGFLVSLVFAVAAGALGATPHAFMYLKHLAGSTDALVQTVLFLDTKPVDHASAFSANPVPAAVNGSFWTLQPEVKCYLTLVMLGLTGLLSRRCVVLAATVTAYLIYAVHVLYLPDADYVFCRLLTYFLLGAAVALDYLPRPRLTPLRVAAVVLALAALTFVHSGFILGLPLAGSYLLLGTAFAPVTPAHWFFNKWDLSFGIYLYAYPVQQLCVKFGGLTTPWELLVISLPITLVLALLSWVFVESRFLKSH